MNVISTVMLILPLCLLKHMNVTSTVIFDIITL